MHSFAQDFASPSARGRSNPAYVDARLRPPSPPRHLVRRLRLLALLDDLAEYPIAMIVAPAGSGKTVLAADWLQHSGRRFTWLSLDAADASTIDLGAHGGATRLPLPEGHTDTSHPRLLHERLAALLLTPSPADSSPMTLVLDDVDRLGDDEAAHAALDALLESRPPWLHLLLISRRRPPIRVDRLRASGDLADVTFEALRFSEVEAAMLLTQLCPGLAPPHLAAAVSRADGWAAALQLTALALRSRRFGSDPATPLEVESARLIDDYLWEEVLGAERPELVEVLDAAAVVGRIDHCLAEALTERADAGDLLQEAQSAGLFLTALPDGWFELHSLVREALLTRLDRRWPDGLRKKHARAAQWFESRGDRLRALDHWLAAERPTDALRALSDVVLPLLDADDGARAAAALHLIPPDVGSRDPADAVRYAWCQLAAGPSAFHDVLSITESEAPPRSESSARRETLHVVDAWLRADWPRATGWAEGAAGEPPDPATTDPIDRFGWRMAALATALDECWDDRQPTISRAWTASRADPAGRAVFGGARALGLALAGHPRAAGRVADSVRGEAAPPFGRTLRVELALAGAVIERELDHREAAAGLLEDLAASPTYPDPVLQVVAQVELLRLRLSAGDGEAAAALLDETERLCARLAHAATEAAPDIRSGSRPGGLVARAGVELALAMDDPGSAARWSEHVSDAFWGPACDARIELAHGRPESAEGAVRRAQPRCPRHRVVGGLLLAQALERRDRDAAARTVTATLAVASRHALLRTVASDGAPIMELIELAAWRVPDLWMDRLRHALVPTWTGHDARRPIENLTDRERDVLRLLPSRLTLGEIAAELFVSQNTLKFHLRAIYRKLGAESRSQAVDTARQMRLLPGSP